MDGRRSIEAGSTGHLFQFRLAYTDPVSLTPDMLAIQRTLELSLSEATCIFFDLTQAVRIVKLPPSASYGPFRLLHLSMAGFVATA